MAEIAPNLSHAFTRGERIYAVPAGLSLMPMAAHVSALAACGLKPPTSVSDLIDLAEQWLAGPARQQPEYSFLAHEDNLKTALQGLVISSYVDNMLGTGQELTFDTPLFRGLMARLEGQDVRGQDDTQAWEKLPLLEPAAQAEPRHPPGRSPGAAGDVRYLVLPMEEGQLAAIQANVSLVVVMATSQQKEAALRFVEALIQAQHPVDQAAYKLSATSAIDNPDFEAELQRQQQEIDQLTAQVQQAEGFDRSRLENRLDRAKQRLSEYEATARYLITAEELDAFHQLLARAYIRTGLADTLYKGIWDEQELPSQYMEGAISLDQLISQLDDKLRLIYMENQ